MFSSVLNLYLLYNHYFSNYNVYEIKSSFLAVKPPVRNL